MTDFPDWGGTPLVTADITVMNVVNATLAQGQSQSFVAAVIRPSYNIRVQLINQTDNVTLLPVKITVVWLDTATGFAVNKQVWNAYAGSVATSHIIRGHGPAEGDQVQITVTNNSAGAVTLQYSIFMIDATRQFASHDWRTDTDSGWNATGAGSLAGADLQSNIVGAVFNTSINAGASLVFTLPLMSGECYITLATTGGNATFQVEILNAADVSLTVGAFLAIGANQATQPPQNAITLPRSQVQVKMVNNDTVTRSCSFAILTDAM